MLTKKNTLQNKNSKKLSNCISAMAAFAVQMKSVHSPL